jgi:hypothetical protein
MLVQPPVRRVSVVKWCEHQPAKQSRGREMFNKLITKLAAEKFGVEETVEPEPILKTHEIVRGCLVKVEEPQHNQHITRLAKFSLIAEDEVKSIQHKQDEKKLVDRMRVAGFPYAVRGSIVQKFEVTAGVNYGFHNGYYGITYCGDIPEFALDRLEKFYASLVVKATFHAGEILPWGSPATKEMVIAHIPFVTIHSNDKDLPIKTFDMRKVDPVLIGWPKRTFMSIGDAQQAIWLDNKEIGFVIAVWDNDKELEL